MRQNYGIFRSEYVQSSKSHTHHNIFSCFSFDKLNASSKCPSSFWVFFVLFLFIAIPFDTSDMSFSFSPLSTQVTNFCSTSLIVLSAFCLNPSASFISWSIISICLLFLFCSFSDLFVSKCTLCFCWVDWEYYSFSEETLNSWSTVLLKMRSFTFWCDVIVNASIFWFTRFSFRLNTLSTVHCTKKNEVFH